VLRLKNAKRPLVFPDASAVVMVDWLLKWPFFFCGLAGGDTPGVDQAMKVLLNADLTAVPTRLMDDRVDESEEDVWWVEGGPCEECVAHKEPLASREPFLRLRVGNGDIELGLLSSSSLGQNDELEDRVSAKTLSLLIWCILEWSASTFFMSEALSRSGSVGGCTTSGSKILSPLVSTSGVFCPIGNVNVKSLLSFPNRNALYRCR
jgi:hypothetical protein